MEMFKEGEFVMHKLTKERLIILKAHFEKKKLYGYYCRNKQGKKQLFTVAELEKVDKQEFKVKEKSRERIGF